MSHLLELKLEIKQEEDEIFSHINSLINGSSDLYSSSLGVEDEEEEGLDTTNDRVKLDDETENFSLLNHVASISRNSSNHSSYHNLKTSERLFEDDQTNSLSATSPNPPLFNTSDRYEQSGRIVDFQPSDDATDRFLQEHLEQENVQHKERTDHEQESQYMIEHDFVTEYEQNDQQNYQALQAVIQQVTSNLPKPCVFFLEGNCRRSDCKYSHDLSNITCKYWIEGFCFKGEMCPFLHSYTSPDSHDSSLFDEDGLKVLTKKNLNPTFVIESEADFPPLPLDAPTGSLNDSSKSSIGSEVMATTIKNQILSSNTAVVFKTVKKKRKKG